MEKSRRVENETNEKKSEVILSMTEIELEEIPLEDELKQVGLKSATNFFLHYGSIFFPKDVKLVETKTNKIEDYPALKFEIDLTFGWRKWISSGKSWRFKRITFKKDEEEVLYILYQQPTWCFCSCGNKKELRANIYLAKNNQLIGSVTYGKTVGYGSSNSIVDTNSGLYFKLLPISSDFIAVKDPSGTTMAIAEKPSSQSKRWDWFSNNFIFEYSSFAKKLPATAKAVILASLLIQVHMTKVTFRRRIVALSLLLLSILLVIHGAYLLASHEHGQIMDVNEEIPTSEIPDLVNVTESPDNVNNRPDYDYNLTEREHPPYDKDDIISA